MMTSGRRVTCRAASTSTTTGPPSNPRRPSNDAADTPPSTAPAPTDSTAAHVIWMSVIGPEWVTSTPPHGPLPATTAQLPADPRLDHPSIQGRTDRDDAILGFRDPLPAWAFPAFIGPPPGRVAVTVLVVALAATLLATATPAAAVLVVVVPVAAAWVPQAGIMGHTPTLPRPPPHPRTRPATCGQRKP